jgi:patatin-like phospholipase/acyl hydrolase
VKPLRKHVVISVDGGGLRGITVANALQIVEAQLIADTGKNWYQTIELATGTSTGSIISSALMYGMTAKQIFDFYQDNAAAIFKPVDPLIPDIFKKYKFDNKVLREILEGEYGNMTLADIWNPPDPSKIKYKDLVIVVRDLVLAKTTFLKSWKDSAGEWRLVDAVLASTAVPTQFPVVNGRYVDGGVGSYSNPSYVAYFEAMNVRKFNPAETTILSFGTGQTSDGLEQGEADNYHMLDWIPVLLETFLSDASEQQINMIRQYMDPNLDFRRFQVHYNDKAPNPSATDPKDLPILIKYGEELGRKVLADEVEPYDPGYYQALPPIS